MVEGSGSDSQSAEEVTAGLDPARLGSFGEVREKDKEEKDASPPEKELFIKKCSHPALALHRLRVPAYQWPRLITQGEEVRPRRRPGSAEERKHLLRSPEEVASPQLPSSRGPCTTGPSECLHLIYSCVQGSVGTRSAPRAGLCVFITTRRCVDSPPYRSHLHHFTHPPGARGLLPDLTSGAGRGN